MDKRIYDIEKGENAEEDSGDGIPLLRVIDEVNELKEEIKVRNEEERPLKERDDAEAVPLSEVIETVKEIKEEIAEKNIGAGDVIAAPLLEVIDEAKELKTKLADKRKSDWKEKQPDLMISMRHNISDHLLTSESVSLATTPGSESCTPLVKAPGFMRRRRSDRRLRRLNTELLEAVSAKNAKLVKLLLERGASPNATCRKENVSVCHISAIFGHDGILKILLDKGAERDRVDILGRTPLHLAIWGGHVKCVAMLLDMPDEIVQIVDEDNMTEFESEAGKERYRNFVNLKINERQEFVVPDLWKDNIDHECWNISGSIPTMEDGWSPLHVASARCRLHCIMFLIKAGADLSSEDPKGRTPLDVVGLACLNANILIDSDELSAVVKVLIQDRVPHRTMKADYLLNVTTPLHVAVEMGNLDAIKDLIEYGAYPATLNEAGETPLHLAVLNKEEESLKLLLSSSNTEPFSNTVDIKNIKGDTILETAVREEWIAGVCLALEHGADIAEQSDDGETSLHAAASLGNIEILDEILSVNKDNDIIDCKNHKGETALFKAVEAGSVNCVLALLREGASYKITLPGNKTILHKAAEFGNVQVLKEILSHIEQNKDNILINLKTEDQKSLTAIHFAAVNNQPECVKILLEHGADIRSRTGLKPYFQATSLHLACIYDNKEVVKSLLTYEESIVHEVDGKGFFPIHTASHHCSKGSIPLLIKAGADLSSTFVDFRGTRKTTIDLIINNMPKPTEYLDQLFDLYITTNGLSLENGDCEICVDYSVLMPKKNEKDQMKVLTSLLNTGNRCKQKRLLRHPLIESFLHLKWNALSPFFYGMLAIYAFFVVSLTVLVISCFYYSDAHIKKPFYLDETIWTYLLFVSIGIIVIQEMLYICQNSTKYFQSVETWVKWGSILLSLAIPFIPVSVDWYDIPRHVATLAILLSWTELMFFLSRCPDWGYYVLMFAKVARNVIRILLTFFFLVIGFTLAFMLQFHNQAPFDSLWSAFVKTMVMMTSEFDYSAIFDDEHTASMKSSLLIGRVIFMVFVILAAIVLMNLLVGVAVNDISDLEIQGNIQRLAKQVDFLGTLDVLVYDRVFSKVIPRAFKSKIRGRRNVQSKLIIYPARPRWSSDKVLASNLTDSIILKATNNEDVDESGLLSNILSTVEQIRENTQRKQHENLRKLEEKEHPGVRIQRKHEELKAKLTEIADDIKRFNEREDNESDRIKKTETAIQRIESALENLTAKVDMLIKSS